MSISPVHQLFRVDAPARMTKSRQQGYALDEGELTAILDENCKEGVHEGLEHQPRFKGLGK